VTIEAGDAEGPGAEGLGSDGTARGGIRIATAFSSLEAEDFEFAGKTAVVLDVVRATTVIVEALAAGARAIYPTMSTDDAIRLAQTLGREDTLLCGERRGLRVEGFDLGNSPAEFTADRVRGRQLVMSTTNGTRALWASQPASRVVIGAFTNLGAVARAVAEDADVVVVCAGKEGGFALDDAVCAGHLVKALVAAQPAGRGTPVLDDASRAALALAASFDPDVSFLLGSAAGHALTEVGLGSDLSSCIRLDVHSIVPEMQDRMIRVPNPISR
jgi:2-phosphosulfolactate phosphatase